MVGTIVVLVLIGGGLVPAIWMGLRGRGLERLIAAQLAAIVIVPVALLLARGYTQPSYLIVPLILAVFVFAGALVLLRVLARGSTPPAP
ncbi:hypothetical protein [Actinoplanes sp. NPDC051851]|uniref:hypothetical protein n=1 Tax=Actinoplanes sp. NPDC051851 TaxID=3154753 RepID=UPI00344913E1